MSTNTNSKFALIKMGSCYILFITVATALCFRIAGVHDIASYASKSKPYSVLFGQNLWQGWGGFSHSRQAAGTQKQASLLFFGDSNMFYPFSDEDKEMAPLLEKALSQRMRPLGPRVSSWQFMGAWMFHYYCMSCWALKTPPDLIIIPINWRSFSRKWTNNKKYFHPELSGLVPLFQRFPSSQMNPIRSRNISMIKQVEYKFSLYSVYFIGIRSWARSNIKTFFRKLLSDEDVEALEKNDIELPGQEEIDAEFGGEATQEGSPKGLTRRYFKPSELRLYFSMKITDSNPTIRALSALAYVASKHHDGKVLFFIWPLDADFLAENGAWDEKAYKDSLKVIMNAADSENIEVLDLSSLLDHEHFFDDTGHCRVNGREKIAEALAPKIVEILERDSGSN